MKGSIDGHPALMVVDTGASSHVVAGWFARKFGLTMRKAGDVGTDHVGRSIPTTRIDDARLEIDGLDPLAPGPLVATEVPEIIEKLGIAAFVSPQRLATSSITVVMDMPARELRTAPWNAVDRPGSAPGTKPSFGSRDAQICRQEDSEVPGLVYLVAGVIDGLPVRLLVDSGAQRSDVLSMSPPGKRLAARARPRRESMYSAAGKVQGKTLGTLPLSIGAHGDRVEVEFVPGESDLTCPRDGVVGMDLLQRCVLVLAPDALDAHCTPAR